MLVASLSDSVYKELCSRTLEPIVHNLVDNRNKVQHKYLSNTSYCWGSGKLVIWFGSTNALYLKSRKKGTGPKK